MNLPVDPFLTYRMVLFFCMPRREFEHNRRLSCYEAQHWRYHLFRSGNWRKGDVSVPHREVVVVDWAFMAQKRQSTTTLDMSHSWYADGIDMLPVLHVMDIICCYLAYIYNICSETAPLQKNSDRWGGGS